jgi:hypothetical protein
MLIDNLACIAVLLSSRLRLFWLIVPGEAFSVLASQ